MVSLRDKLPCIVYVYDFIVRTHHLDLLSRLLAYYLVDLLLRNGWHSVSLSYVQNGQFLPIQREVADSNPIYTNVMDFIEGHQFLLNMLIKYKAHFLRVLS